MIRTPTAITASNGLDVVDDGDDVLLTSVVDEDSRSVALKPWVGEEPFAAWI